MGKGKSKKTASKGVQGMDVDPTPAESGAAPGGKLSAKDKLRRKMESKKSIKVKITELKKTRTKIGKAKDRRMERRVVTDQLKQLKVEKLVVSDSRISGSQENAVEDPEKPDSGPGVMQE